MSETKVIIPSELDVEAAASLIKFYGVSIKTSYDRAKVIAKQLGREGVSAEGFAKATTELRIQQRFPGLTLEAALAAHEQLTSKEKVSISGQTLRNYKLSWDSVVDSAIIPDVETVDAAFKVISRGKWAKVRKELEGQIAELPQAERRDAYLASMTAAYLIEQEAARTASARPEGNSKAESEEGSAVGETVEGLTLASVEGFLKAVVAADWSPEELDSILASLAATVETLAISAIVAA